MKIYRTVVMVVAIILGISFCILGLLGPGTQMAINDPVTEEDYELLRTNALEVAKTLDKNALNDKTLTADFYFETEKLVVTVGSSKASVTAKIPVLKQSLQLEDETIVAKGTVEFEKVEFVETSKLQPVWWYIMISITGGLFVTVMVNILCYKLWIPIKKHK